MAAQAGKCLWGKALSRIAITWRIYCPEDLQMTKLCCIKIRVLSLLFGLLLGATALGEAALPTLHTHGPEGKVYVGMPFTVTYVMTWEEEEDFYLVRPPELPTPDWGVAASGALEMMLEDTQHVWRFDLEITPEVEGEFTVPALDFFYFPAADVSEVGVLSEDTDSPELWPSLSSDPIPLSVYRPVSAWIIGLPVLGVLVLALASLWFFWWRRGEPVSEEVLTPRQWARQEFHQVQRLKLDGELYPMYQRLLRIVERVGDAEADKTLIARLRDTESAVGYQGKRPSEDELNGDTRDVERVIARLKEESRE